MTLDDIIIGFYKGTTITVIEAIHDNKTGEEDCKEITTAANDYDAFTYDQLYNSKVMMFECVKKNTLKVWTYREIN